jgi:hypothetical protein
MATVRANAALVREQAAETRRRSEARRAHMQWSLARARKEVGRARQLVAAANDALGLDLVWHDDDAELERALVLLEGGRDTLGAPVGVAPSSGLTARARPRTTRSDRL